MKESNLSKILFVGYVGLEASLELVKENEEELNKHFSKYFMAQCKKLESFLVKPELIENAIEVECSLWSTLWNICELNYLGQEQMGIDVDVAKIPIRQETIEICQFFGLNPYKISSKGCYLIFTSKPDKVIGQLEKAGNKACVIGVITNKKERIIRRADDIRYLPRPPDKKCYMEYNKQIKKQKG